MNDSEFSAVDVGIVGQQILDRQNEGVILIGFDPIVARDWGIILANDSHGDGCRSGGITVADGVRKAVSGEFPLSQVIEPMIGVVHDPIAVFRKAYRSERIRQWGHGGNHQRVIVNVGIVGQQVRSRQHQDVVLWCRRGVILGKRRIVATDNGDCHCCGGDEFPIAYRVNKRVCGTIASTKRLE